MDNTLESRLREHASASKQAIDRLKAARGRRKKSPKAMRAYCRLLGNTLNGFEPGTRRTWHE